MKKSEAILAAVAVLSVVIYALACRPAWHPSGKSIAVPFVAEDCSGVVLCELSTKQIEILLAEPDEEAYGFANCVWLSTGKTLVITAPSHEGDAIDIKSIDLETKAISDVATIDGLHESWLWLPSIVAEDRYLWLANLVKKAADESYFVPRVDLLTGKVDEFFTSKAETTLLFEQAGGTILCVKSAEPPEGESATMEVAIVDGETGETTPLFKIENAPDGLWQYFASDAEGNRFAVAWGDGPPGSLAILGPDGKTVKEYPLEDLVDQTGYATWIGDWVWLGALRTEGESGESQLGLLAVNADSGKSRFVKLADDVSDDDILMRTQPSVSPDGRTLAVGAFELGPSDAASPTVLVTLDLTKPDAVPVFIPLGPLPPDLQKEIEQAKAAQAAEPEATPAPPEEKPKAPAEAEGGGAGK